MKTSTYSSVFDLSGKKRNAEVKDCNRVTIEQSVEEIEIPILEN